MATDAEIVDMNIGFDDLSDVFSGDFKPVGLATRNPQQMSRFCRCFSIEWDKLKKLKAEAPEEEFLSQLARCKADLESAKKAAMTNFFDLVGETGLSLEAHFWLMDYEYSLRKWANPMCCSDVV